jgi:hypothetical protein
MPLLDVLSSALGAMVMILIILMSLEHEGAPSAQAKGASIGAMDAAENKPSADVVTPYLFEITYPIRGSSCVAIDAISNSNLDGWRATMADSAAGGEETRYALLLTVNTEGVRSTSQIKIRCDPAGATLSVDSVRAEETHLVLPMNDHVKLNFTGGKLGL